VAWKETTVADAEATLEPPLEEPEEIAAGADDQDAQPADAEKPAKKTKEPRKPRKGKAPEPDGEAAAGDGPSVAGHPRAARSVARAKSWGALFGFVLGGYLSLPTHTLASAGLRAIVAGLVCYVAVWAGAVFFWRRLVMLEIRAREHEMASAAEAARARHQAAATQGAQAAARTQAAAQLAQESRR
jgi:hypothetical protein